VESQNPPGSPPRRSPSDPEQAWISPRLRAKLDDEGPETPREGPPAWIGIVLAVLVVVGGAGLFVAMRTGAAKQKVEAARLLRERAAAAAAESLANVARIDSMRTATRLADSLARAHGKIPPPAAAATPPKPAAPKPSGGATASTPAPAATPTPAAAPAKPAEKVPFGLDVGTFLDEDRAKSELEKLSAATGLKGSVITRDEVFHVVLGSFPSRAAADKRAEALVGKSLVSQAESISLAQ
jgi:cell division septation protein DedD